MARQLPPLNQLRVFEAAARLGSFKRAAEELNVTQTAVSHQIRTLEDLLGCTLFHRLTRGVRATEEADAYQRELARAFDLIEDATRGLQHQEAAGTLNVSVAPSFAIRWLLPRLQDFSDHHPEIHLETRIDASVVDFADAGVDAAIRHGAGNWRDLAGTLLFEEELIAVGAPHVISEINAPADLTRGIRLLGASARADEWPMWFSHMGVSFDQAPDVLNFPTIALALDAAVSGQGVTLTDRRLVTADLEEGRLAALQTPVVPSTRGLWLVHPRRDRTDGRLAAFQTWLQRELA